MSEIKATLDALETRIQGTLEKMNSDVEEGRKESKVDREEVKAMLADHASLVKSVDGLKTELTDIQQKQTSALPQGEAKSMGAQLVESDSFKAFKNGEAQKARFELKNTIVTGGDNSVSRHAQMPGVVEGAFRMLTVMPTVDMGVTDSNIVYYSRELLWTNNAAGQTEGSPKAESVLTFEEVNTPVQTIAHFLKVSKQALDDSSFLASYIDRRMRHGVNNKVESQVIAGTGVGTQLSGWLAAGNFTATSPLLTGNIFGLANKMKYEVIAADYEPSFYYFNPADWAAIETIQRGAGDAAYVAASGAISYVNNGLTPLLWGLPVVLSNNVTAGTIICKSREADMYVNRESTVIEMFEQDDTNVQSNLVTVRGETRGAALNFRPTAIRTGLISGIT